VTWTPVDLDTDFLEDFAHPQRPGTPAAVPSTVAHEELAPR
jgi:hypothetical protein